MSACSPTDSTVGLAEAPLQFIDHHRLRHAAHVPAALAGDGMFLIGSRTKDGDLDEDGEFTVRLIRLSFGRGGLHPRLEAYRDGGGALRRAIEAGLLDALDPVGSREAFSRRLLAIGMVDDSDEPPSDVAGEG